MQTQIAEYTQTAAALGELRQKYEKVVFPVTTTAGMKDALAARKELRDIRVGLEKMRKDIKAPALERCRLIDEEAKTITAQLVALEDPIDSQIKAEETRKEREKQERERIERERVAAIRAKIDRIGALPSEYVNDSAAELAEAIADLEAFEPTEAVFAEFVAEAANAKDHALRALKVMHERQAAQEAERAELERLRAERAAQEAELRAQQAALDAQRAEIERQRLEFEQARAAADDAARKAEEAAQAPAEPQPVEAPAVQAPVAQTHIPHQVVVKGETLHPATVSRVARPSDDEIITVLADHYFVHESKVIEWLLDMDLKAVSRRMVEAA